MAENRDDHRTANRPGRGAEDRIGNGRESGAPASHPVIIGTAGHVDHGKTTLVKALTGVDTDRLQEEKRRGISIDLGFAEFRLPGGRAAAIIDVPGHERFIHNMVAGVHGIDLVLLVVAADEGVMPQTVEHLDILELLGVRHGLVALTKVDLVPDPEWLALVEADVRDALKGTFLEGAPVIPVAAPAGTGLERLVDAIEATVARVPPRDPGGLPRLPIDRVFSVPGFGTVVTGTLVAGTLRPGQHLVVEPGGLEVRVRHLQVHGREVDAALAGQRVAANLAGVEHRALRRGQVLVPPGTLRAVRWLAGRVRWLARAGRPLRQNQRVRLHTGAAEVIGRVTLLGPGSELAPGAEGWILFRAEEPVVAAPGDRFVLRTYSPMHTAGGGVVADAGRRWRRRDGQAATWLQSFLDPDPRSGLRARLQHAGAPVTLGELVRQVGAPPERLRSWLEELAARGAVRAAGEGAWLVPEVEAGLVARVREILAQYHRQHPLEPGMTRDALVHALWPGREGAGDLRAAHALLDEWVRRGIVATRDEWLHLPGWHPQRDPAVEAKLQRLLALYEQARWSPPAGVAAAAEAAGLEPGETARLLALLEQDGKLVRVEPGLWFAAGAVEDALARLRALEAASGPFTVAQARDALGTTRKYALPLLEYFDRRRWTRREGDLRRVTAPPGTTSQVGSA